MINETIKKGRKYRVKDKTGWTRFSFWTKGSDVECDDGRSVEEKVGAINGITDDITSNASDMAASIKAVKKVHDTAQNSIKNLNIQNSNLVYETNSGDSGTIPLSYSLESLGITASSAEINALNGINTNSTVCTEDKVMDIISQKIPTNIGWDTDGNGDTGKITININMTIKTKGEDETINEEIINYENAGNICKVGDLVVAWGRFSATAGANWGGCTVTIQFNNISFSSPDTWQFICNTDGLLNKHEIKEKANTQLVMDIGALAQGGGNGYVTWLAIGY